MIRLARLFVAVLLVTGTGTVAAQGVGLTAAIASGTCQTSPKEVGSLTAPDVARGEPVGADVGWNAATSYTQSALSMELLLARDHVIQISEGDEVLSCGAVGGVPGPDGSLAIVLSATDIGGIAGVAYLTPVAANPALTGISLFVDPGVRGRLENGDDQGTADESVSPTPLAGTDPQAASGVSEQDAFRSGGLGLSLEDWEAQHGTGVDIGGGYLAYRGGNMEVQVDGQERIRLVIVRWEDGVSLEEARQLGLGYAPPDAQLVETYVHAAGLPVDLYYSESLRARFPDPEAWRDGAPGNFAISYGQYASQEDGTVLDIYMAIGNNP